VNKSSRLKTLQDASLIRTNCGGIRVVNVQGFDRRRRQLAIQSLRQQHHVMVRVPGGIKSGRSKRAALKGYILLVLKSAPPPECRQAPIMAGKQVIVRMAIPPP